jgi:hypothetical protein
MAVRCSVEREENGVHEAKFLTCWTCSIVNATIACKRMRLPTVWSVNNEIARIVKEMQHDTTRSCELPSKGSIVSANYTRGEER